MKLGGQRQTLPIMTLGQNDRLTIGFDDLGDEHQRYCYTITHCNADWTPSDEIFESDYLASTGDAALIDDYEPSSNTTCLYTHYSFSIPNAQMRPLISGNYRINIFSDDTGDTIAQAFFCILEPRVSIEASMTTNTEIDWNESHQQIDMQVNATGLVLHNAEEELYAVVLQNMRWDNAAIGPKPTACFGNTLKWEHCRALIFDAGNEYRKFEMTSTKYAGMGVESIRPYEEGFLAKLFVSEQRKNYLYDEDNNGISVIRTEDYSDADTEADYVLTEFTLASPPLLNAELHIGGQWNNYLFDDNSRMEYADGLGYTKRLLLKQGYYNYMYYTLPQGKEHASTLPYEGNFYQTENQYTILVYYKEQGARYTRLVGRGEIKKKSR